MTPTTAKLALEDGTVFDGLSFGAHGGDSFRRGTSARHCGDTRYSKFDSVTADGAFVELGFPSERRVEYDVHLAVFHPVNDVRSSFVNLEHALGGETVFREVRRSPPRGHKADFQFAYSQLCAILRDSNLVPLKGRLA